MTSNQISYWANKEKERNNRELEKISEYTARENARHNKAYEDETKRHNEETEKYGYSTLAETNRHNLAIESISAQEAETKRQQQIAQNVYWENMAEISAKEAEAQLRNAEINAINAATRAKEVEYNNVVNMLNAGINERNARSNEQNVMINMGKLKVEQDVGNARVEDYKSQKTRRTVQNIVDSVSTGVDTIQDVIGLVTSGGLSGVLKGQLRIPGWS